MKNHYTLAGRFVDHIVNNVLMTNWTPENLSFISDWMADGMTIEWRSGSDEYFQLVSIWTYEQPIPASMETKDIEWILTPIRIYYKMTGDEKAKHVDFPGDKWDIFDGWEQHALFSEQINGAWSDWRQRQKEVETRLFEDTDR